MSQRALRRHHRIRLLNKRKYYYRGAMIEDGFNSNNIARVINTPKSCSCWMCGNPRKYHKELTVKEQKWIEIEKQEYKDYFLKQ